MIGIFDSGAGGLTVLKEIRALLPKYDIIYFGDTARYPYGSQSEEQLKRYAREDAELLIEKGVKIMVIACNSASAVAGEFLREELSMSVFEVTRAAVDEALKVTQNKRIGVIGTKATITSGVHEKLLKKQLPDAKIFTRAAALLVPLVEERWQKRLETVRILRRYLRPLKNERVDTLILGCTHYPMLEKQIKKVMGTKVRLVNSARSVAEDLKNFLEENSSVNDTLGQNGKLKVLVSSDPEHFKRTATQWLGYSVEVEKAQTVIDK